MDTQHPAAFTGMCIRQIRERLENAHGLAKVAEACAEAGNTDKAIEIALDIEQLMYEAGTLLNAASLLNRLAET